MKEIKLKVLSNKAIASNVYEMEFAVPENIILKSGQFINLSTGNRQHLLRRPFAIAAFTKDSFSICYQIKGSGTESLKHIQKGSQLSALLPLGNYFLVKENFYKIAVVGGGIGIFPLLALLKEYKKTKEIHSYIGFRSASYVCKVDDFQQDSKKAIFVTDDGSFAKKGNVVDAFISDIEKEKFDVVYACGPIAMLVALKEKFKQNNYNIPCFISLEERMGCGIGACLVCVCKNEAQNKNFRVCKDGPIFELHEVNL